MKNSKKIRSAKLMDDGRLGETKVCMRCGRLFAYLGYGHFYCPMCKKVDDADFLKVKNYIYENGVASAIEVSDQTGISLERINQYLKEGRLEIPESSPIFIKCELCAADIRSGRLCKECASKLTHEAKIKMNFDEEQIGQIPKKLIGKMRYFGKEK